MSLRGVSRSLAPAFRIQDSIGLSYCFCYPRLSTCARPPTMESVTHWWDFAKERHVLYPCQFLPWGFEWHGQTEPTVFPIFGPELGFLHLLHTCGKPAWPNVCHGPKRRVGGGPSPVSGLWTLPTLRETKQRLSCAVALVLLFVGGCPKQKRSKPQKGFPFFPRVTEQLRRRAILGVSVEIYGPVRLGPRGFSC